MDTAQILQRLNRGWLALLESIQGLPEAAATQPGVVGTWSVKDLLGHVTTWEEEAIRAVSQVARGAPTPRYRSYGGIDAFNAREAARKTALSLLEIQRQLDDTHRRLLDIVSDTPKELWATDTLIRRRLRWDTYAHYREHARQIQEWRKAKGL